MTLGTLTLPEPSADAQETALSAAIRELWTTHGIVVDAIMRTKNPGVVLIVLAWNTPGDHCVLATQAIEQRLPLSVAVMQTMRHPGTTLRDTIERMGLDWQAVIL